jgi:exosortase
MARSPSHTAPLVRLALLGGCLVVAFGPLLAAHASLLWQRPHYQHFPIVPLGVAWLAMRRLPAGTDFEPGTRRGRQLFLGGAWSLLAMAVLGWSPWMGMVAALALLLALCYCLGGGQLVRQLLPAWAVLWLMVPLPLGLDARLVAALQPLVTRASSRVLDLLEVWHIPSGNILVVEGRHILVEEACSGIQSLFSLVTCASLYVLWARRPLVPSSLLLVAAVFASILANVSRVVASAYLTVVWNVNVEEGWRHEAVGLLAFVVCLGLLWSWDYFLWFFWHPAPSPRSPTGPTPAEAGGRLSGSVAEWAEWLDGRLPTRPLLIAFGLLAGLQTLIVPPVEPVANSISDAGTPPSFDAASLPEVVGPWRRREFKSRERGGTTDGRRSFSWTYESPAGVATVSLDAPFVGWHPLEVCYQALGWTVEKYEVRHAPTPTDPHEPFVVIHFRKPLEYYGYLCYSVRGERGRCLSPPPPRPKRPWVPSGWVRLCERFNGRSFASQSEIAAVPGERYEQEQLFVETAVRLPPADLAGVEALYFQTRARLRQR